MRLVMPVRLYPVFKWLAYRWIWSANLKGRQATVVLRRRP
jgi:hypothetical protein